MCTDNKMVVMIFSKKKEEERQRKFQLHCQHKSYVFDIFFPRLLMLLYGTSQCVKKRHHRIDSDGNKMIVYLELKSDQSLNVWLWAFTYPSMFLIPFLFLCAMPYVVYYVDINHTQ